MSGSSIFGRGGARSAVVTACVCFIITALLIPVAAFAAEDDLPQTMPIQATVTVDWNVESGRLRNEGRMSMNMQGTATLAPEVSVMDAAAPPGTIVTYSAEGVNVAFSYEERIYQEDPPRGCSNLMAEYQGGGSFTLKKINSAMTSGLNIRKMGSLVPKEMLAFAPPEAKEMMIDYYDFFALAEKQSVNGRKRGWNDCNFQPDSKEVNPAQLSIRFRITDEGKMKGRREWSFDGNSGDPSFHMLVSDLPEKIERRPLVPEPDGGNEITYAVNWHFGEVDPHVVIERKEGGQWTPLPTDEPVEVTAGEKMELRGIVLPEKDDPKKGEWVITGESGSGEKMYIKKYDAGPERGRVVYLDPGKDQKNPEILFFWVDEGTGKVEYKTTAANKELTESVEFEVKKPKFRFEMDAKPENRYGLMQTGDEHPGDECCLPQLTDEEQKEEDAFKEKCENLKKELASLDPNNDWDMQTVKPQILQELIDNGCTPMGVQYEGITFTAEPLDDTPGEVRFVQKLSRVRMDEWEGKVTTDSFSDALDGCYPYPKNISAYATYDAPGFSAMGGNSYCTRQLDFEMYLLFKPSGEGNEWVPLKKALWQWRAGIRCVDGDCSEDVTAALIPSSGPAEDCSTYPEWDDCSLGK